MKMGGGGQPYNNRLVTPRLMNYTTVLRRLPTGKSVRK